MNDSKLNRIYNNIDVLARNGIVDADILAESHDTKEYPLYAKLYDKLDDVYRLMNYLRQRIVGEFPLYCNESGRYEAYDGEYYTSGSTIEFFYGGQWLLSTVEHDSTDYYIVGYKDLELDGLYVRVRSRY